MRGILAPKLALEQAGPETLHHSELRSLPIAVGPA